MGEDPLRGIEDLSFGQLFLWWLIGTIAGSVVGTWLGIVVGTWLAHHI